MSRRSKMEILIEESLALRDELLNATKTLEQFAQQLREDARRLEEGNGDDGTDSGGER